MKINTAIGVITTDRVDTLTGTLVSLFMQTFKEWDLHIFDNGSTPATHNFAVNNLMDLHSTQRKVQYHRLFNQKGLVQGKKYLLETLTKLGYTYGLLSDDDNVFMPDYVAKVRDTLVVRSLDVVEGVHVHINNAHGIPDYSNQVHDTLQGDVFIHRHFLYSFDKAIIEDFADYSSSIYRLASLDLTRLDKIGGIAGGGYLISKGLKVALRTGAVCYESNSLQGSNWRKLPKEAQKYCVNNLWPTLNK